MNNVKGLTIYVYRNSKFGDCSNGGISSRYDELILVGEGIEGPVTVDLDNPPENVVKIVKRKLFGGSEEYMHIEPLNPDGKWFMAGGNVASTSDSSFPSRYHSASIIDARIEA